jgi:CRP/FNR family cyclic AMP-dependent transcriptional regulator
MSQSKNQFEHVSLKERQERLSKISLFEDLLKENSAIEILAKLFVEKDFEKGSFILTEAKSGNELYILVHGEVTVLKSTPDGENYPVAILKSENNIFFGEGGLLEDEARSASIRADSRCQCLILDKKHFDTFCAEHADWALPIIRRVAQKVHSRLRKANQDMMLLYNALVGEIRGR